MKEFVQQFKLFILVILGLLIVSSCSKFKKKSVSNENAEMLVHDGETREYLIHVPASYDGSTPVPLMLNFHGYGGTATDHQSTADMRPLADAENFILVYPQGALLGGDPHWNAGLDTPDNKSDTDDLGFIEALLDELSANYSIDLERVYACGYSNGSFFSYALACFMSDKIAAIGSVSGTMLSETLDNCNPSHPTPMINLHGTSDGVVPYDGDTGLESIGEVVSYWVTFNNTNAAATVSTETSGSRTIEYSTYPDGDNGVTVEHYKFVGGKHVWFNNTYNGSSTNQLIWDYVKLYDINGLR